MSFFRKVTTLLNYGKYARHRMLTYNLWKKDYESMQEEMIYGDSLSFDEMIAELRVFNAKINEKH